MLGAGVFRNQKTSLVAVSDVAPQRGTMLP